MELITDEMSEGLKAGSGVVFGAEARNIPGEVLVTKRATSSRPVAMDPLLAYAVNGKYWGFPTGPIVR